MADEREGSGLSTGKAASEDKIQQAGRKENAAQPLNAADDHGGAERYPEAGAAGEQRSFDPSADAPTPKQGAGDGGPSASTTDGRMGSGGGSGGDPVEGKR